MFALSIVLIKAFPTSYDERSASIQEQAQDDYKHHQDVLNNQNQGSPVVNGGYNSDGSFGLTYDNKDKNYRDRGYGYEKAYAYSRETAFFDYLDNKPSINAKDLVEKYGNSEDQKNDDLLGSFSY